MTDYKTLLIKMIDRLPDKAVQRVYRLAEYLYIYGKGGAR